MYLINAIKIGAFVTFLACLVLILSLVFHLIFGWEFEKAILVLSAIYCATLAIETLR